MDVPVKGSDAMCAIVMVEPTLMEEVKFLHMEDPKLNKISDQIGTRSHQEFTKRWAGDEISESVMCS